MMGREGGTGLESNPDLHQTIMTERRHMGPEEIDTNFFATTMNSNRRNGEQATNNSPLKMPRDNSPMPGAAYTTKQFRVKPAMMTRKNSSEI